MDGAKDDNENHIPRATFKFVRHLVGAEVNKHDDGDDQCNEENSPFVVQHCVVGKHTRKPIRFQTVLVVDLRV